jgi:hypothetical protein
VVTANQFCNFRGTGAHRKVVGGGAALRVAEGTGEGAAPVAGGQLPMSRQLHTIRGKR